MIDSNEWKVRIYENPAQWDRLEFYIISAQGNIRSYVSDPKTGEMTVMKEGEAFPNPSMILTKGMAQALFTALQGQGMKPVEQSYVEGKLEAVKEHLKDMRELVFEDKTLIINEKEEL